jgi:hypothetical protein
MDQWTFTGTRNDATAKQSDVTSCVMSARNGRQKQDSLSLRLIRAVEYINNVNAFMHAWASIMIRMCLASMNCPEPEMPIINQLCSLAASFESILSISINQMCIHRIQYRHHFITSWIFAIWFISAAECSRGALLLSPSKMSQKSEQSLLGLFFALVARRKASNVHHLRQSVTREFVQGATCFRTGNRLLGEADRLYRIHFLKEKLFHIGSKSPLGKIMAMKLRYYCVKIIKFDLITQ